MIDSVAESTLKDKVPPTAGDVHLVDLLPTLASTIVELKHYVDDLVKSIADAESIGEDFRSLAPGAAIPEALAKRLYAFSTFVGGLTSVEPLSDEDTDRLYDLARYVTGEAVVNDINPEEDGEFLGRDDYAILCLGKRIGAIDWTREPTNDEERTLRLSVIRRILDRSPNDSLRQSLDLARLKNNHDDAASDLKAARETVTSEMKISNEKFDAERRVKFINELAWDVALPNRKQPAQVAP